MVETPIPDPVRYLEQLGGLHDVHVNRICYDETASEVVLDVVDIHANFAGLPEYQGGEAIALVLQHVQGLRLDVGCVEGLCISEARICAEKDVLKLELDLCIGGTNASGPSVVIYFDALAIRKS